MTKKICWISAGISSFMAGYLAENVDEWKKYDQYRRKCFDLYSRVVDTPPIFNFNNGI